MSNPVLFLCSGNYYRSRFAEYWFNHLAAESGLAWRATSRGLIVDGPLYNIGAMSMDAYEGLRRRGVSLAGPIRFPRQVTDADLASAERIVAVKGDEHRPMLAARWPGWVHRVEYWDVDDLGALAAESALSRLDAEVRTLIAGLSRPGRSEHR